MKTFRTNSKQLGRLTELMVGVDETRKFVVYSALALVLINKGTSDSDVTAILHRLNANIIVDIPVAKKVIDDFTRAKNDAYSVKIAMATNGSEFGNEEFYLSSYKAAIATSPKVFRETLDLLNTTIVDAN